MNGQLDFYRLSLEELGINVSDFRKGADMNYGLGSGCLLTQTGYQLGILTYLGGDVVVIDMENRTYHLADDDDWNDLIDGLLT